MYNNDKIKIFILKNKIKIVIISIILLLLIITFITLKLNKSTELNSSNNVVYSLSSKDAKIWVTSFENDGIAELSVDTKGHNVSALNTTIFVPARTLIKKVSLINNNGIFDKVLEIDQSVDGIIRISLLRTDLSSTQRKSSPVIEIQYDKEDKSTLFDIMPSSVFRSELIDSQTGQNVLMDN